MGGLVVGYAISQGEGGGWCRGEETSLLHRWALVVAAHWSFKAIKWQSTDRGG